MQSYKSKTGKSSGVEAYKIGSDYIIVKFKQYSKPYKYSYSSAGVEAVEEMKNRALINEGLSTYISQNNPPFE